MKELSVQRIRRAILDLHRWRKANDSQGAMHLVHLLAAKYAGASEGKAIPYTEQSVDFTFCDKFLRVNDTDHPYFDPLDLSHRIGTHPHSNVATARKKTFSDKWRAGKFEQVNGSEHFKLETGYVETLIEKMGKQGRYTKLAPSSLAIWLYREKKWDDTATIADVVELFRREFHFTDQEWRHLFLETDKTEGQLQGAWSPARDANTSKTIIDVLSRDVEGFNVFHSLMAIREVCRVPIIDSSRIVQTMDSLNCRQIVIQGPPGTGKTYLAKQIAKHLVAGEFDELRCNFSAEDPSGSWGILQLHPSYGYEDFIQRLVPARDNEGGVVIRVEDMPFVIACKIASSVAPSPFVLIVDEINRADLQKVFGELMYALEYRGEPISLQYSGEDLIVPSNLYLVGTMNTADSSVVQVDYAIRRRFLFFDAPPDRQIIESEVADPATKKAALALFDATCGACEHHARFSIGHTYFMYPTITGLLGSFVYQVLPVLRAYRDNGVVPSDVALHLKGWDADPITPDPVRPDVLLDALSAWAAGL